MKRRSVKYFRIKRKKKQQLRIIASIKKTLAEIGDNYKHAKRSNYSPGGPIFDEANIKRAIVDEYGDEIVQAGDNQFHALDAIRYGLHAHNIAFKNGSLIEFDNYENRLLTQAVSDTEKEFRKKVSDALMKVSAVGNPILELGYKSPEDFINNNIAAMVHASIPPNLDHFTPLD